MEEFKTVKEFIADANKARLACKDKWTTFTGIVAGKYVRTKNYNTYLQICEVDGRRKESGLMDMSVAQWKQELEKALSS